MSEWSDSYKQMGLNSNVHYTGLKKRRGTRGTQIHKENALISIEIHKSRNKGNLPDFNSLIEELNGNNPVNRENALKTLCSIKSKKTLPILINALKNKDTNVRWKVARYLGHLKNKNAVEPLIKTLKDHDFIVRNTAAWSLGEIGDERAIEALTLALKDENKYVKGSAMEALNKIRTI